MADSTAPVHEPDHQVDDAARRSRYALDMLAMLGQALSVEELERLCHVVQWPLERSAADKGTAARAIIAHCDVVIRARQTVESRGVAMSDWAAVLRARSEIALQQEIRGRWLRHLATPAGAPS